MREPPSDEKVMTIASTIVIGILIAAALAIGLVIWALL